LSACGEVSSPTIIPIDCIDLDILGSNTKVTIDSGVTIDNSSYAILFDVDYKLKAIPLLIMEQLKPLIIKLLVCVIWYRIEAIEPNIVDVL